MRPGWYTSTTDLQQIGGPLTMDDLNLDPVALQGAKISPDAIAPNAVDELNERECKNDYASRQNSIGDRGVARNWARDGKGTC
jgi:hypothetical protein